MRAWYDIVTIEAGAFEDESGIRASEKLIVDLVEEEEKKGISSKNIALAGFSQGGVIALQCGLRYPKPLAGIIALSTYLPLADTLPGERTLVNQEIPVFIAHGARDEVIPVAWARNSRQILKQHGYVTEWHEYAMAHSICPEEIRDIALFLEKGFVTKNVRLPPPPFLFFVDYGANAPNPPYDSSLRELSIGLPSPFGRRVGDEGVKVIHQIKISLKTNMRSVAM